ncbi:MAG: autotransporter domain-containing protein [Steroidobacter sp.]
MTALRLLRFKGTPQLQTLRRPARLHRVLTAWRLRVVAPAILLVAPTLHADPPSFSGSDIVASGPSTIVNLRGQGAVNGTAPLDVRVNAVRVGGILSPLISVLRAVLQPGANASVCVQVQNLLGLDLTFLGVELDVTAFNAESPNGVNGRIVVRTGIGSEDVSPLACADAVQLPPVADAGPDQNVADTDQQPGEQVSLDGGASDDPDGAIALYEWRNTANQLLATGATASVRLADGLHTIRLTVTDNSGARATDTLNVRVTAPAANQPPVAEAGANRIISDTDEQAGENVSFDGAQSTDPDGAIVSYEWLIGASTLIATGVNANVRLPDGAQTVTLRVTDNDGGVATDAVTITVGASNPAIVPVANAGADRIVADTDAAPGESVILDASASTDPDGVIVAYEWSLGGQLIATGATAAVQLADGESFITLAITDDGGNTASDGVLLTVLEVSRAPPIAVAGADLVVADTNAEPGESVVLDASGSSDADGVIIDYQWSIGGRQIATGANATVQLPDGLSLVTLTVVDDDGISATDSIQASVAAPPLVRVLSLLPGLTPNQLSVAEALDSMCPRLRGRADEQGLETGAASLLAHCDSIMFSSTTSEQVAALDEISPQDLNATRTQTLNLSRSQLANVADRLIALRGGAKGLSLVGLNLQIDGQAAPLQQLADGARMLLGGGAGADDANREHALDDLLDDRLGVWLRGNYSFGDKDGTLADHGFEADQWGLMGGVDFRFSSTNVAGIALGYGRSAVTFSPVGAGTLDTAAMTGAVYATMYSKNGFYVDAIANYLQSSYDSQRHILFTEGGAPVDVTAAGETTGETIGVAFVLGYDIVLGAFTVAPSLGYNYMTSSIDEFRENGASGLDLRYERQDYLSATANAGLRLTFAWKTSIGVIVPQLRGEYIREFVDDTEAFGVRFASDPFEETPLIVVHTDVPDRSYWRVAAGLAAQFKYGISGFVEYQRLESLEFLDYADVALGMRFELGF